MLASTLRTSAFLSWITVTILVAGPRALADVKLPALISDHMVLQQGMPASIWGTADPNESVNVRFREKDYAATAGSDGKWLARLETGPAGGPFELAVTGKNTVRISDVWVGEVWICSGQSNMQWTVSQAANPGCNLYSRSGLPASPFRTDSWSSGAIPNR